MKKLKKSSEGHALLLRGSGSERVIFAVIFVIFTIYSIALLYPLVYLGINSFHEPLAYLDMIASGNGGLVLPKKMNFENYVTAFNELYMLTTTGRKVFVWEMYLNTIWWSVSGVAASLLINSMTAYVLSKYRFTGQKFLYTLFIVIMILPITGNLGARLNMVKNVGIYNSYFYNMITSMGGYGMHFLVLYGVFKNVSWSYAEAVFIDGGGHITVFFKIMLPQIIMPMLSIGIVSLIGAWNDEMTPLLYTPDIPTVASGLYKIKSTFLRAGDTPAYYAGLLVSVIPTILIYYLTSETIFKHFSFGGLKG